MMPEIRCASVRGELHVVLLAEKKPAGAEGRIGAVEEEGQTVDAAGEEGGIVGESWRPEAE
jgi:hypothetical protein